MIQEIGLIGKKIGMTREFYKSGQSVPVTAVKIDKGRIIQLISKDQRGYNAIQVGFGKIKNSKLSKQMKGFFSKKNTEPKKILKEFRVSKLDNYKEGNELGLEIFKDAKFVDVRSKTIGKGFAGAMKRHNFGGLRASHGVSISHRSHGSTGNSQDPGRVFKGKKMAGQMGNRQRTIQNLQVVAADEDRGLIFIKGGLPGSKGSWISLKDAVKKALPSEVPYPAGLKGAHNSKNEDDKSDQSENTKLEEAPKEEMPAKEETPKEALAKVVSTATNLPLDRLMQKVANVREALAEDTQTYERVFMLLGWPDWDVKPELPKKKKKKKSKIKQPNQMRGSGVNVKNKPIKVRKKIVVK